MQCKLGLETGFQDLTKHLMSMVLWCCPELHCQKYPQQSVCAIRKPDIGKKFVESSDECYRSAIVITSHE